MRKKQVEFTDFLEVIVNFFADCVYGGEHQGLQDTAQSGGEHLEQKL